MKNWLLTPLLLLIVFLSACESLSDEHNQVLDAGENLKNVETYRAEHEFQISYAPFDPTSPDYSVSTERLDCQINQTLNATLCERYQARALDQTLVDSTITLTKQFAGFWTRQEDESWELVPTIGATGANETIVDPRIYLATITDAWVEDELILPNGNYTGYGFSLDVESFLEQLFQQTEGTGQIQILSDSQGAIFYETAEGFQTKGYALVNEDENRLDEFSVVLDFTRDGVRGQILLTQVLSEFDQPFELPDISE